MDWRGYIHSDPEVLSGKPVVRGTRLAVDAILALFAAGWTQEQVLENHAALTSEALRAVFAFAAECVRTAGGEGVASMPDQDTMAALIQLAIMAERSAEALYRGLEAMFAHSAEVAGFWSKYAAEEAGHARWIEGLRDGLSAEALAAPADPGILIKARDQVRFSVERALAKVEDLEDAYQLVSDLENSETNVVFEFLIVNFGADRGTQEFLRSQLRDHVGKLMSEFPLRFQQAVVRREVKAVKEHGGSR